MSTSPSIPLRAARIQRLLDRFPWEYTGIYPSVCERAPTVCKPPQGMHFNLFTSSELIGGNAEQDWLTERELEVDPTWAEHMCMGPIYCFHHLPSWG